MIVTLCGSARFEDHFKTWNEALTMAGHTVFTLTRYASEKGGKNWYTEAQKLALDEAHKRKINASEAVLVLNVFGYMGPSTLGEVEHAKARGKKLYALESWGAGNGICGMHFDHVQEALRRMIPEGYVGSPIDTTSPTFRYAYDLFDGLSYDERCPLVELVKGADGRAYAATSGVAASEAPSSEEAAREAFELDAKTRSGGTYEHVSLRDSRTARGYINPGWHADWLLWKRAWDAARGVQGTVGGPVPVPRVGEHNGGDYDMTHRAPSVQPTDGGPPK